MTLYKYSILMVYVDYLVINWNGNGWYINDMTIFQCANNYVDIITNKQNFTEWFPNWTDHKISKCTLYSNVESIYSIPFIPSSTYSQITSPIPFSRSSSIPQSDLYSNEGKKFVYSWMVKQLPRRRKWKFIS